MADPTPTPPAAPSAQAIPAKSGNRTLIVVLCLLGGILLLIGGCVTTCVYIGAKKAREYAETAEKNPAFATISLLASLSPEVTVVSKDATSGKITLRNKKSGEIITLDTNEYTPDNIGRVLEEFARGLPVDEKGESPSAEIPVAPAAGMTISLAHDGTLEVNGEPATLVALPELARQAMASDKDAVVLLITDEDAPLAEVTQVTDACRKAGFTKIRLRSR